MERHMECCASVGGAGDAPGAYGSIWRNVRDALGDVWAVLGRSVGHGMLQELCGMLGCGGCAGALCCVEERVRCSGLCWGLRAVLCESCGVLPCADPEVCGSAFGPCWGRRGQC